MLRVARLAAVLVIVSIIAAACSSDGFTYIENEAEGLYFKVPDDWIVSEGSSVLQSPRAEIDRAIEGLQDPTLPALPEPWRVSIEGTTVVAPGLSIVAQVVPIGSDLRDQVSIGWMKQLATDSIDVAAEGSDEPSVNVLYDEDLVQGDLSGNRIVIDWVSESGIQFTKDQLIFVDPAVTRLYGLIVLCDARCYRTNFDEIDAVMNSFTVEG
jgi:hypothetical protein